MADDRQSQLGPYCEWCPRPSRLSKVKANQIWHQKNFHAEAYAAKLRKEQGLNSPTSLKPKPKPKPPVPSAPPAPPVPAPSTPAGPATNYKSTNLEVYLELESVQVCANPPHRVEMFHDDLPPISEARGWLTDGGINVSLEILADITDCTAHKIAIMPSFLTGYIYNIGARPEQASIKPGDFRGTWRKEKYPGFEEQIVRMRDKDFIFLPISNGYETTDYNLHEGTGVHWSLLVVDCRNAHKELKFRHFDSMGAGTGGSNWEWAEKVRLGVYALLEDAGLGVTKDTIAHDLITDPHMPQQDTDDLSGVGHGSACGVFSWAIAKELALYIVECNEDGMEIGEIELIAGFRGMVQWRSLKIRETMIKLVKEAKRRKEDLEVKEAIAKVQALEAASTET